MQVFGANVTQRRGTQHGKMQAIFLAWFKEEGMAGPNVDSKVLREQTDEVAPSLGTEDIQASGGGRITLGHDTSCCTKLFLVKGTVLTKRLFLVGFQLCQH